MSLDELLRSRIVRRIRPNRRLAISSLTRARRDIDTARTLIKNKKFDWSLAVSYNAMLWQEERLCSVKAIGRQAQKGTWLW